MAQTWTVSVPQQTNVALTDLTAMRNNFAALQSSFSGNSTPTNVVGGQPWHRSTARKVRNYANSAWLVSLLGDANQKMWVYRNTTCEGWLIDAAVTDAALAIKGGAAAYNVAGGNLAGTWTQPNHYHTVGSHTHSYSGTTSTRAADASRSTSDGSNNTTDGHSHTYSGTTGGSGTLTTSSDASANTWRVRAAVGTLQYPDLS